MEIDVRRQGRPGATAQSAGGRRRRTRKRTRYVRLLETSPRSRRSGTNENVVFPRTIAGNSFVTPMTPRIGGAASRARSCGSWKRSASCRRPAERQRRRARRRVRRRAGLAGDAGQHRRRRSGSGRAGQVRRRLSRLSAQSLRVRSDGETVNAESGEDTARSRQGRPAAVLGSFAAPLWAATPPPSTRAASASVCAVDRKSDVRAMASGLPCR